MEHTWGHQASQNAVILLQIAMVSPETHFMKNHESQFKTNESQSESQWVL